MDSIRDRINQKLKEHSLSVRGASLKAGLGETTLRNYLRNMNDSVTVRTLEKLAPVLHVSVQWLQTGDVADDPDLADVIQIWDRISDGDRAALSGLARSLAQKAQGA